MTRSAGSHAGPPSSGGGAPRRLRLGATAPLVTLACLLLAALPACQAQTK